ncbi:tRNA(Ile)-lysidine synthase [Candidatus Erwinia haradaeae]|uniref:tRNA(Ile)-lysidine synthase n=1 Tax=Candidatus Erwinia haradaeae TaxID=1922217 RepID=A0A451DDM1_9GAMM|nr:tRNA lysidine(34) synthetase TilS [Candidatus Erwinia haradaeae]VFP84588.1 tRNA(Ile)-lysidine synthase [Candidatus Erwinia haradaeae]
MSNIAKLKDLLINEHAIMIAYSGGLDSTVLLHQLVILRQQNPLLKVRAMHINHNLYHLSDSWAIYCKQQCEYWNIPLEVRTVQVNLQHKNGVEAAARQVRYQALYQNMQAKETLLTAQHQDDQSETFMLALKRGSGPTGLSGMASLQLHGTRRHIRPFLNINKLALKKWANQHKLSWIVDPSNNDKRYDRNFLRLKVMPLLNQRWPHFARAVSRSAQLCSDQEKLLDEYLIESLHMLLDSTQSLYLIPLHVMSKARRFALLRRWLKYHNSDMPSYDTLQHIWKQVACSRADANPRLKIGNNEVRRFCNRLYFLPIQKSISCYEFIWEYPWRNVTLPGGIGQIKQCLSGGVTIRCPLPDTKVCIRFQAQGMFYVYGRSGSRSIKKLWQEYKIPPWNRARIPLIFYDNSLVTALGVFITVDGHATSDQETWNIDWLREKIL